jgi:hypothetical protein
VPARRKRRSSKKKKRSVFKVTLFLVIFFFVILPLTYFLTVRNHWNGKDKLSVVIRKESGDIVISTFDPGVGEIINIAIPANTQVEVARGLGLWEMGSVWELAENEGLMGDLVVETVTRYFKFPVYIWADQQAIGFTDTNLLSTIKAGLYPYKTNLSLVDRVRITLFAIRVQNPDRVDIDLSKTPLLKEATFIDGTKGFVVASSSPYKILSIFSDPLISKEGSIVVIKDASGNVGLAEKAGEIIEVLGAKVVSIKKESRHQDTNSDCLVKGKKIETARKIAKIFSCRLIKGEVEGNFDLEIMMGEEFAKRY